MIEKKGDEEVKLAPRTEGRACQAVWMASVTVQARRPVGWSRVSEEKDDGSQYWDSH